MAFIDCMNKLGKRLSKDDKALLQQWIDQGLTDDEVLQRYDLHIEKKLVDIVKLAQERGAKVSVKRDVLGELRSFGEAKLEKARTRLAEVRKEHDLLGVQYGEIGWIEGNIKHWEPGGQRIDLNDDGQLYIRFEQMSFLLGDAFKRGEFGDGQVKGNNTAELVVSFRAMQARGDKLRAEMQDLFREEVSLLNEVDDLTVGAEGTVDAATGEYFMGPLPPSNVDELKGIYIGSAPWTLKTGKNAEGDLYIQRHGVNAGTPHRTRQGPNDFAISFNQDVLLPDYAYYLLRHLQPQMAARAHGTAQQAINKRDVEEVMVGHFQNMAREDDGEFYANNQPSAKSQRVEEAKANYKAIVKVVKEGEIRTGITNVKTAHDAAHVLAEIRKNASEGFWALVLDKDNNVVGVVEHGRGTIDGTSVYPSTFAGAVLTIPGAAKVWMAHNHPSGTLQASQSDIIITKRIGKLLDGSDVQVLGHVLMGGQQSTFTMMDEKGTVIATDQQITPAARTKTVPVFTRKLRGPQKGQTITSPAATKQVLDAMGNPDGVLMLNNRHQVLGFLSMTAEEMRTLKGTGQGSRLIRAFAEMNVAAFMVSTKQHEPEAANNMAAFANASDWRMLDAFYVETNQTISMQERGQIAGQNEFYQLQSNIGFTSGLLTAVQTMSRKKGTVAEMLGGLRKIKKNKKGDMVTTYAPGVTKAEMDWLDVEAWAEAKGGIITRQEMIDYVRANGIVVEEVQFTGDRSYTGQSLPGGTAPRDIFLKLPEVPEDTLVYSFQIVNAGIADTMLTDEQADEVFTWLANNPAMEGVDIGRTGQEDAVELHAENINETQYDLLTEVMSSLNLSAIDEQVTEFRALGPDPAAPGLTQNYALGHFAPAQKNIIAWIRTTSRIGPNGEKILFIEEIQSDWHQKGAKFGYRDRPVPDRSKAVELAQKRQLRLQKLFGRSLKPEYLGYDNRGDAIRDVADHADDWVDRWDVTDPKVIAAGNEWLEAWNEYQKIRIEVRDQAARLVQTVPDAPFKGRGWPRLAIKRMIRLAAEEGYDQIAWTTGEQQNARNNLAVMAERVSYDTAQRTLFVETKVGYGADRSFQVNPDQFEQYMGAGPAEALRLEIEAVTRFYEAHYDEELNLWEIIDGNGEQYREGIDGAPLYAATEEDVMEELHKSLNLQDLMPSISGDTLDSFVGEHAEAMPNFYDRELKNLANEAGKKLDKDAAVEVFAQEIYIEDGAPFTHELRHSSGDQNLFAWYVTNYHGRSTNGPFTEESMAQGVAGQHNTVALVHKLEITDQMRAAALEGQTLMQGKKGAISFDQARKGIIKMTEARDLSTFMHEAAHLYLEIMRHLAEQVSTPQAVKDDYAKILEYLAVGPDGVITREQHEKWAESFEKYLYEGKAPSVALQSAFNAFRRWLTEIWKRMKGATPADQLLTPEIRGVMDRILASEDQIAVANSQQEFAAVFSTAEQMGVTQREFDVYKNDILKATNEAIEEETQRLMAAHNREAKRWWKDEKAKVRAQVELEAWQKQENIAFFLLSRGTKPDGSAVEGSTFKIDKTSLLEVLAGSKETLKALPQPWVYTVKDGVDVDVAAIRLGYPNGHALVTALMEMPRMSDWIKNTTEQRMAVLFPDPLLDGSVSESALRAVHNEARANVLVKEMRELRRLMKEDRPIVAATKRDIRDQATASRLANKGMMPKKDEIKLIKVYAKETIAALRVMDVRPEIYLNAERKAGKLAFEAAARGDYEKAYNFKRQQTVNHEMYRESVRAKDRAVKTRNYLAKFLKPRVIQRLGKLGVIEPIHAVLEGIELKKVTLKSISRKAELQKLAQAIHDGEIVTPIAEHLYHVEVDEKGNETVVLNEAPLKNWQELTIDELQAVRDIVKQLEHQAKKKLELPVNGVMVVMDEAINELTEQVNEVNKEVDIGVGTKGKRKRIKQAKDSGIAHWLSPSVMSAVLDKQGWGATTRLIVVTIRRAMAEKLMPMQRKAINDVSQIFLKYYATGPLSIRTKELGKLEKREIRFRDTILRKGFATINGESLSKGDVISIGMHMGSEGNRSALFNGIRIDDKIAYPEDEVWAALNKLDANDWHFIQEMWDYLDSYWPALSAMERQRRGISPEKVEHLPFTVETSDGQIINMKGGYMPLSYNYEHSERHEERVFEDHFKSMRNSSFLSASTRAGATHNRVKNHNMVVQLGLFQIEKHLKEITRDIAIGDEVNFVNNLLQDKGYRKAMKQTGNAATLRELELWLTDAAVGELPANNMVERLMAYGRVGFTISKLAFNVYTTVLQLTGIFQSTVVLGSQAMAMGAGRVMRNPVTAWTQARDASAFLRARYGWDLQAFDRDVHDAAGKLSEYGPGLPTTYRRIRTDAARLMFLPIAKMQQVVDVITWWAAVWKGRNEMGHSEHEAVLYADAQVELAQTSGFFSDRSGIERGTLSKTTRQQQFIRLWTVLISYMQRKLNIAYMKTQELKEDVSIVTATYYAIDMLLLFTAEGIASAMLYDRWDWDEDDPKKILIAAAKETALSVAAGIPFLREFQSAIYGSGNTPIGALGNDLVTLWIQAAQGEMDPALRKAFVNSMGILFHLPASQTNRLLEALIDEDDPELLEYFTGTRD